MITDATMREPGTLPHRSMLFVPGSNASMLTTAYVYGADAIMFDLEDAVALREKDSARLMVFHALGSPAYQGTDTVVRINPLDTPYGRADLEASVRAGAGTIRLPKTESADDIRRLEHEVEAIERDCGREVGSTRLMAAVESAGGVVNAVEIATASPRMVSIALAGFDYVIDLRTTRSPEGTELFYARCAVLHAARVARIAAYDVVWSDVNDEAGFLAEVELVKRLGFDGKSLVNPRQIPLLHNAYAPTEDELAHARLVVSAAEKAARDGLGVVSLGGKMIDAPIIAAARRTIAFADASGVRR
ncbi:aldolase/citrate lyase family protein [Arsenicicoccus sp. oral taxon 190]|uniref:aldolase/citrate lyase family protein n=1 Tax=Arsenicicoccus sp. oral taxon 190 TaxID=1658671 RepID=UPI00067A029B|nr:aldolase/citrate lyase family protein [Arsenicicoccus sp. oral taxon 190]AKT52108.1 citrate lyase subunit beta [Arsenicicoccus sp. oral taxon 190]